MNSLWGGNGLPDLVGEFDPKSGHVTWEHGERYGNYFNNMYELVPDPQCANVTSLQGLANQCTLQAAARRYGRNRFSESSTWNPWEFPSGRHYDSVDLEYRYGLDEGNQGYGRHADSVADRCYERIQPSSAQQGHLRFTESCCGAG